MSAALEQQIILTRLQSIWDFTTFGPLVYPNKDNKTDPTKVRTTVTISHDVASRTRESLGSPRMTTQTGFLVLTVHAPLNGGTLVVRTIEDAIRVGFDEYRAVLDTVGKVVFGMTSSQELGAQDGSYRINILCPFKTTEFAG